MLFDHTISGPIAESKGGGTWDEYIDKDGNVSLSRQFTNGNIVRRHGRVTVDGDSWCVSWDAEKDPCVHISKSGNSIVMYDGQHNSSSAKLQLTAGDPRHLAPAVANSTVDSSAANSATQKTQVAAGANKLDLRGVKIGMTDADLSSLHLGQCTRATNPNTDLGCDPNAHSVYRCTKVFVPGDLYERALAGQMPEKYQDISYTCTLNDGSTIEAQLTPAAVGAQTYAVIYRFNTQKDCDGLVASVTKQYGTQPVPKKFDFDPDVWQLAPKIHLSLACGSPKASLTLSEENNGGVARTQAYSLWSKDNKNAPDPHF